MQFFTFNYWFGFPGFITTGMLALLIVLFTVLFVGGLVAQIFNKKITDRYIRQVARRAGSGAAWIGAIGLCLVFARYQRTPLFMYRYWFLILGIALVVWVVRMRTYAEARREALDAETHKYNTKDKYLQR